MVKPNVKVILIGVLPESLLNFRGELIQAIKTLNKSILTVSAPLSDNLAKEFSSKCLEHRAVDFQRNGLNPLSDLKTFLALYRIYKAEKPQQVLAYTIKPVIWGGIAARLAKVPFYALITGLGFAFQGKSFKRKLLTKFVSFLYRISLSYSKKIIFQNEDNRRLFVERGIVQRSKTIVINGSGVDISRFYLCPLPDMKAGIQFLCIARLLGEKGLREYAQAASIVKAKYPHTQLVLVGSEDTSPDGVSLSEVTTWKDVDYIGAVHDVRPFIEKAHVYVLPSYHEGLPRSTIEAMAMGRPVITTDAVGCKETVEEGINGFKVPISDAIMLAEKMVWFIEHSDQIKPMGLMSRKITVQKFDVHKINAQMLKIIEII